MSDATQLLNALQSCDVTMLQVWDSRTHSWVNASDRWIYMQADDCVCINAEWAQTAISHLALPRVREQSLVADLCRCSAQIKEFCLDRKVKLSEWKST